MAAAAVEKTTKKVKENATPKHLSSLPKQYKIMAVRRSNTVSFDAPVTGSKEEEVKPKGLAFTPRKTNMMLEAHQEFEAWRKGGFKSAWWWANAKGGKE